MKMITNKSLISCNDKLPSKLIKLKDKDNRFSKVDFKNSYSILTPIINLQKKDFFKILKKAYFQL